MFDNDYLQETEELNKNISQVKHKIIVMSGKGGVGKSTVSANLAGFLSNEKFSTGLLDIDLHGPSIPKLLGLSKLQIQTDGTNIMPIPYNESLKIVSIANMLDSEATSIIWRGPKKNAVIRQFLKDVNWGILDYLIIDSPPGTGDEQLAIVQSINGLDGAIIVTTPQDLALLDVKKSINFCKQLKVPILGLIENMSGFVCPNCNKKADIFKSGGGEILAKNEGIEFFGKISIDPLTMMNCDAGILTILSNKQTVNKTEMTEIFKNLLRRFL